jgi:hypothetical protein
MKLVWNEFDITVLPDGRRLAIERSWGTYRLVLLGSTRLSVTREELTRQEARVMAQEWAEEMFPLHVLASLGEEA